MRQLYMIQIRISIILLLAIQWSTDNFTRALTLVKRTFPPSSPSSSFFDFEKDPFAHQLAETFNKPQSQNENPSTMEKEKEDEVVSKDSESQRPYVYIPRKKQDEYSKDTHVRYVREYLARVRSDPLKREASLKRKRERYVERRQKFGSTRPYRRNNRPLTPLKDLIRMEKSGALNGIQQEELKHQREIRRIANQKYKEKTKVKLKVMNSNTKNGPPKRQ